MYVRFLPFSPRPFPIREEERKNRRNASDISFASARDALREEYS